MAYWLDWEHQIRWGRNPERALHVCGSAYEAATLYCMYHSGHSCPRCVGPLAWFQRPNLRKILDVAQGWLSDPQHDSLRARGAPLWHAFCRIEAEVVAALEGRGPDHYRGEG